MRNMIEYALRRENFDIFEIRKISWYGAEEQMSFLGRLYADGQISPTKYGPQRPIKQT